MKRTAMVVAALAAALIVVQASFAGSSLIAGYGGESGSQTQVKAASTKPASATKTSVKTAYKPPTTAGSLPFTGSDLGLVLAVGAGLVGLGLVIRRSARGEEAA